MRSWRRSFVAALIIAALGASSWAPCVEDAMSTPMEQMACCADGHHTCGSDGSPADCCKQDASKQRDVVTIAKADAVAVPVPVAMEWATFSVPAVLDSNHRPYAYAPSPPTPAVSRPAYIVFSTLLI